MPDPLPRLRHDTINGRAFAWREAGGGTALPLVLLHGIGSNSRCWGGQLAHFSSARRVIAWNAPGYAGSDPLPTPWPRPDDYGAALLGLLDHLGVERCVVVGQSLGAIMATAAALMAPARFAAMALASPAIGYGIAQGAPLPDKVAARIEDLRQLGPVAFAKARAGRLLAPQASKQARAVVEQAMSEVEPQGYGAAVHLLAGSDLLAMVPRLDLPAIVMWGAQDVVTPPAACASVAAVLSGARAVEISGGGHAFATETSAAFNSALAPLLAAVDQESLWI